MNTNVIRKSYVTPRVIRHGDAAEKTRGNCSCKTETCQFQPAPAEEELKEVNTL